MAESASQPKKNKASEAKRNNIRHASGENTEEKSKTESSALMLKLYLQLCHQRVLQRQ